MWYIEALGDILALQLEWLLRGKFGCLDLVPEIINLGPNTDLFQKSI